MVEACFLQHLDLFFQGGDQSQIPSCCIGIKYDSGMRMESDQYRRTTGLVGQGIQIRGRTFELRPYPVPTLNVEDEYLPSIWKRAVYPMADKLGGPVKLPDISPQPQPQPHTDKDFGVFAFAEAWIGRPVVYGRADCFFQQGMNIDGGCSS